MIANILFKPSPKENLSYLHHTVHNIALKYLWVGKFAVTPSSINHVSLSNHFGLRLVLGEPDKPEPFGVASLQIPLDLEWTEDMQALLWTVNISEL